MLTLAPTCVNREMKPGDGEGLLKVTCRGRGKAIMQRQLSGQCQFCLSVLLLTTEPVYYILSLPDQLLRFIVAFKLLMTMAQGYLSWEDMNVLNETLCFSKDSEGTISWLFQMVGRLSCHPMEEIALVAILLLGQCIIKKLITNQSSCVTPG